MTPPSILPLPIQQVAIAVVWHEEHLLIGKRPEGVPLSGYWEFPGGKVEPGESPEAAARRECREETGVAVITEELYLIERITYDHAMVELHFFRCRCAGPPAIPTPPYRWVPRRTLEQYDFPVGNQRLLNQLRHPPT